MFSAAYNIGIATKLAERMSREHTAGQLFCNAHIALVWLCLTFILFNQVQGSWLRLTIDYFCCIGWCFIITCSWKFHKKYGKTLVMESLYACNFIKKWRQHRCFSVNFAKFWRTHFVKHLRTATFESLWCNMVLPYPCSIEIWKNLIKNLFY